MRHLIVLCCILAACALASPALAQTAPIPHGAAGFTLTTTPQQVTLAWSGTGTPTYQRIVNPGTSGSAWCSRARTNPAPNAAGSFEIPPAGAEEFAKPGYVPTAPTWCVAASGTVPLTIEVN